MEYYIYIQCMLLLLSIFHPNKVLMVRFSVFYMVIILVLFSGLRSEVGIDFNSYQHYYNEIVENQNINVEYGFVLVSLMCDRLTLGYHGVLFIYSTLTVIMIVSFYMRFSDQPLLSVYLFFSLPILYLSSFNIIRQFLAIAIFVYALKFLNNRHIWIYFICCIFSGIFVHKSAFLMLPMYFVLSIRFKNISYFYLMLIYFSLFFFADILAREIGFSGRYFSTKYMVNAYSYISLLFLLFSLLVLILKTRLILINDRNVVIVNMIFFGALIVSTPIIFDIPSGPIMRLSSYFTVAIPVILVNINSMFSSLKYKYIYKSFLFFLSVVYFYMTLIYKGNVYNLIPYDYIS